MVRIVPRSAAPYRPRVAPETRRLLIAAGIALATLWGLARIRFPDTPVTSSPVPPLLAQLSPPPTFEQLASEVARVRDDVGDVLVTIDGVNGETSPPVVAMRLRRGLAVAILPAASRSLSPAVRDDIAARDPATGLTLVRVQDDQNPQPLPAWTPQNTDDPQFLLATDPSTDGEPTFVPVFVSMLRAEPSRAWRESIWRLPDDARVAPGAFVFTTHGELAGVIVHDGAGNAIVPADVLRAAATGLIDAPPEGGGWLGIDVGPLTPSLAHATGAAGGVIVSWVDPKGPAAGAVAPGDVIEAVESDVIRTPGQWEVATARLTPGTTLHVRIRSNGSESDVMLTTAPAPAPPAPSLGLRLTRVPQTGSRVTAVDPGSAAARAGLQAGDVITRAGTFLAASPADIRRAYRESTPEHPIVLAVTRGAEHHVVALGQ